MKVVSAPRKETRNTLGAGNYLAIKDRSSCALSLKTQMVEHNEAVVEGNSSFSLCREGELHTPFLNPPRKVLSVT